MPTLIVRHPDGSEQEHEVAGQLTIGRAEGNDLVLSEGGVSRKHARFFRRGPDLLVEDVGSANGTFVDGEAIKAPTVLSARAQIVIGDYEISVKASASKTAARPAGAKATGMQRAAKGVGSGSKPTATRVVPAVKPTGGTGLAKKVAPQASSGPTLRGTAQPVMGKAFPLSGTMVVGRVAGVDLQLDDDSVSRKHAEVEVLSKDEVVVRDLGSANGTAVNGAPISTETLLKVGDTVQFGVVEFVYENGPARAAKRPAPGRTGVQGAVRPSRRSQASLEPAPDEGGGLDNRRRNLILGVGGVLVIVLSLVAARVLTAPGPKGPSDGPLGGPPPTPPTQSTTEKVAAMMVKCRSWHQKEDFGRAAECLRGVLELEPIHEEANQLRKQVEIDKGCKEAIDKGQEQAKLNLNEEALAAYVKVTPECTAKYFQKTLDLVKDPMAEVKKSSGAFCLRYFKDSKFDAAVKECEAYMKLACQTMNDEEVNGPPGYTLKLEDGKLKPTEWRPKDPLHLAFFKTRKKLKLDGLWVCPLVPVFRPPPPPEDPMKQCKARFVSFYPHPAFAESIGLYMDAKQINVFAKPLQEKVVAARGLEHLNKDAILVVKELSTAYNYLLNSQTIASNHKLPEAADQLRKGVAIDQRLTLGQDADKLSEEEKKKLLERCASTPRRQAIESFQDSAYRDGKDAADRNDFRAACRLWKLGAEFGRSKTDLLRALNVCTTKANEKIEAAASCAEYKTVLDFAVDGDGIREQVMSRTEKMNCEFDI